MNSWVNRMSLGILALLITGVMGVGARGETLNEALVSAYLNNPTLLVERASLRSTDERVPRALSGWRPTVWVTTEIGKADVETESTAFSAGENRTPSTLSLTIIQPLFRGGRTVAETRRAKNLVMADRARLVETEQNVLLQVASAYMNVLRDQQVLELAINNEQRLRRQLQAAQDRFEVGEVTRTDVAQAEARVSNAIAEQVRGKSDLIVARAAYLNVTGSLPENLTPPPPLNDLPESELASREIATKESPVILRALYIERAARADIDARMAVLLPTVELNGEISRKEDTSSRGSLITRTQIIASMTIPLYQSGAEHSDVRAAREVASQRRIEIEQNRRAVLENVTQSWESLLTARAQIVAFRDAVRAAGIALDGVEQEAVVGSRTILDVLDAEQELFNVRIDLVRAERDNVVASYSLKAAIGRLSVVALGLDVPIYDETRYYKAVRDKAWGFWKVE
ncbi:MAG: TolC family outer membrane protein [Candidatus Hydrogenedentes bacterium]|nr:TolC family outer membrane protein [Candidatus Hydrogenedentota bacterium]